ncbi:MAG: PLDc N-terminal domain-containing protein [Terriglobales bacterium]
MSAATFSQETECMHFILVSEAAKACEVVLPASFLLWQRDPDASPFVACGCLGFFGVIVVAIIALNIALLIWVARDVKSRGMDNAVIWMILVMLTGIIGLIIYLFTRPQGNLVPCPQCGNKRLQVSAKCPHCGNP